MRSLLAALTKFALARKFRSRGRREVARDRNTTRFRSGLASGPLIEVFGELKPGDEIAARGTDEVRAGAQVQVKGTQGSRARSEHDALPIWAGVRTAHRGVW